MRNNQPVPRFSQFDPDWDAEPLAATKFEAEMRSNVTILFGVGTATLVASSLPFSVFGRVSSTQLGVWQLRSWE
jgi:hypothetical protein